MTPLAADSEAQAIRGLAAAPSSAAVKRAALRRMHDKLTAAASD